MGLHSPDGTFTSWNELVSTGMITVDGNAITASSWEISGDLGMSNDIKSIGEGAFEGTEEEWNNITIVYTDDGYSNDTLDSATKHYNYKGE